MPSNLLAHHVRVLEKAGVVSRYRSEADRRPIYLTVVPRTVRTAHCVEGQRGIDHHAGGIGDTLIVGPSMLTRHREGGGHRQAALLGEHTLNLFDDHSAVQGGLELLGDLPRVTDRALARWAAPAARSPR